MILAPPVQCLLDGHEAMRRLGRHRQCKARPGAQQRVRSQFKSRGQSRAGSRNRRRRTRRGSDLQRTGPCVPVGVGTAVDVEGVAAGEEVAGLRFARKDHILVAVGEFDVAIAEQVVVKRDGAARFAELTAPEEEGGDTALEELAGRQRRVGTGRFTGDGNTSTKTLVCCCCAWCLPPS